MNGGRPAPNVIAQSVFGPIIINVHDKWIGRSLVECGSWAHRDIELLRQIGEACLTSRNHFTFYDVGANFGTHALAMAKLFGERVLIRAFEAQRQIYNMLCGTMALNNIDNVYCYLNAVSDTEGETIEVRMPSYTHSNNFGGFELVNPRNSDNQDMIKADRVEFIKTVRIDSFREAVDLIKMDIEGMEDRALAGAAETIAASRPFCFVETFKTDGEFLESYFRKLGYQGFSNEYDLLAVPAEHQFEPGGMARQF